MAAACSHPGEKSERKIWPPETVVLDTLRLPQRFLRNIYFREDESFIPRISGMSDTAFQHKLNSLFLENFKRFADSAKKENGLTSDLEIETAELTEAEPASAKARYEILSLNDSLISVVQYFISLVGHGGNSWTSASSVVNVNLRYHQLMEDPMFKYTGLSFDSLDGRVYRFFLRTLEEAPNSTGLEEYRSNPEKLKFGIRNDSMILVHEGYPGSHSTYGTYLIPVNRRQSLSNLPKN